MIIVRISKTAILSTFVSILTTSALLTATTGPADAAIWQKGKKISASSLPKSGTGVVESLAYDGKSCGKIGGLESRAAVKFVGDVVYVFDACKDGRSGAARIRGVGGGGSGTRFCTNSFGKGTWARCDFNWSEGGYEFTAGIYNQSTGYRRFDEFSGILFDG